MNDPEIEQATPASAGKIDLSLTRRILLLTFPVALGEQLENIVGMVDIFMVGKLGPAAISAVGISRTVVMVMEIAMRAVTTGTFAMVAQAIGAGSPHDASAAAKQSFTLLALLSIGISLAGIVASPYLLAFLSVGPEVIALGAPYLRVFFGGIVLRILNFTVTTCLQGAGNTRTPFHISLVISIVKVLFSYLLIFGLSGLPRLGVTGAAVGTLIGAACGLAVGSWILYSGRFGITLLPGTSYRPNLPLARRILKIGIPSGLQGLFRNGSNILFVKLVALTTSSTAAVAAYSIGHNIERILRYTSLAFGTVATAMVGQDLGAGRPEDAERRGWTILLIGILSTLILGLPVVLFARPILAVFTGAPDVIQIGIVYLYAIALAEPFMCSSIVTGGGLRGAGDTMPALYYTLISQWLIRLPVAYLFAFTFGFGIDGIWASLVIFSLLQGILTVRKFARGEWKERKI